MWKKWKMLKKTAKKSRSRRRKRKISLKIVSHPRVKTRRNQRRVRNERMSIYL